MNDLIARITENVGIEADTARQAVGLILAFLQKEGPDDSAAQMMAAIPEAEQMISEAPAGGGMMGGVMGLGTQLMGLGLGMGEISGVSKETIAYSKEKVGDGPVDEVIASIPGLSQFV